MISVVILTKNEEKNIIDCLESVIWVDEIIIVDDYSSDRTLEVIKNLKQDKIKVYKRLLNEDFASQKNFGLSKVTKEWVFFLDADERVSGNLREEVNSILIDDVKNKRYNAYYVQRKDYMWGKKLEHGESGDIKLVRLGRKNAGAWVGKVHESWMVDGGVGELDNYLIHYPHPTISEFLEEINFYTTIRAKELTALGNRPTILQIFAYPTAKFFLNYVFKLGFLDGIEGLIFAILMSFHSFLVRAKLWIYLKNQ